MTRPTTEPAEAHATSEARATEQQDRIWEYYQNETPEGFEGALPRVRFLAERIQRLRPGARVLNVGVGAGTFEREALRLGLEVSSLDPSERSIATLRDELRLGERAQVGYSQEMPFEDASFDCVVLSEVLEHLTSHVQHATLEEVRRVLAPDGLFLGTVPAEENLDQGRVVCPDCGHRFHRWGHLHSFDPTSLEELLRRAFRVERVFERSFASFRGRKGVFGKLKRALRVALLSAGLVGAPRDTCVLVFEARPL